MLTNYLKIAWRSLWRNRLYSLLNIGGLAVGMAVAMLIGLWVHDELTFDRSFANYDRLGQVLLYQTFSGERGPQDALPMGVAEELRSKYPDVQEVALSSWDAEHILTFGDQKIMLRGNSVEPQFTRMFSLKMVRGAQNGLQEIRSIMLSASAATALFGTADPIGKLVRIDSKNDLTVTGVYEDLPTNATFYTRFNKLQFLTPLAYFSSENPWVERNKDEWNNNSWPIFVQLKEQASFDGLSTKIRNMVADKRGAEGKPFQPELTISPMCDWHLHSLFDKARGWAGRIQLVWLFGLIGGFVLLLACINFTNLNTARSEKRIKEVGIRKAVGSLRGQLVGQFLSEAFLMVFLAFGLALLLVTGLIPWFNSLADKAVQIPWSQVNFWLIGGAFLGFTTLLAGSYPALFLSGFQPMRALRGYSPKAIGGVIAPRKVLVVVQFAVSVSLIIGTMIVYQQIQYAKNRPIGYDRSGLIYLPMNTPELQQDYNRLRADLLETGAVEDMAESLGPITAVWSNTYEFEWPGKDPNYKPIIGRVGVTHDFGKTVGFQIAAGRDFSRAYSTDSSGVILNEAAVKTMGLKKPIGHTVSHNGRTYQVVGVCKDMLMQSPYEPVLPTIFILNYNLVSTITIRLKPTLTTADALNQVAAVFKNHNPNAPFDYKFVDDTFEKKFKTEARIGSLATVFAVLAILISCLGLFGLASFMAEQRTKEIGVRKVLGASVLSLWGLLSKDFMRLVLVGCALATPLSWYVLENWLQQYTYRVAISPWVFVLAGVGALVITLLTVSYQAVKAALMNPVSSLRSE